VVVAGELGMTVDALVALSRVVGTRDEARSEGEAIKPKSSWDGLAAAETRASLWIGWAVGCNGE